MDAPHVLVLGVAQDGGHPQPGCVRSCCRGEQVIPHLTTSVAVVDDAMAWLLDAGPDFRDHLARLDAGGMTLAGILLTHGHMGHYTGLMYLGREAMDTKHLPVWAAPRLGEFLRRNGPWDQLIAARNIDLHVIDSGTAVDLGSRVRVVAFPVPHRGEYSETVGFRIDGPTNRVLYVPDTDSWDGWDTPIEDHLADVGVALLDATFFAANELPGRDLATIAHPLVVDSLTRFSALPDRERAKIRFTHLNHSNPLLDRGSDGFIRVARAGMGVAAEGDTYGL